MNLCDLIVPTLKVYNVIIYDDDDDVYSPFDELAFI